MIVTSIAEESRTKNKSAAYRAINEYALPGDILFIISHPKKDEMSALRRFVRSKIGFANDDSSEWHVALYVGAGEKGTAMMIESQAKGVLYREIPHSYFSEHERETTRIEIARHDGLSELERKAIVNYARGQLGKEFDWNQIKGEPLTYLFGLPNILDDPGKMICQELATQAYYQAGKPFGHPERKAPLLSITRLLGHPLMHKADSENPRFSYLKDHDVYRSPHLRIVAAISESKDTGYLLEVDPGKYSWKPELRSAYNIPEP